MQPLAASAPTGPSPLHDGATPKNEARPSDELAKSYDKEGMALDATWTGRCPHLLKHGQSQNPRIPNKIGYCDTP